MYFMKDCYSIMYHTLSEILRPKPLLRGLWNFISPYLHTLGLSIPLINYSQ